MSLSSKERKLLFVNRNPITWLLLFLPFTFLLSSCSNNTEYQKVYSITDQTWSKMNILRFNPEITDTSSLYNLNVYIRNTNDYLYSNIYMFIDTYFPHGKGARDTVEFILADKSGKWTGRGLGNLKSNVFIMAGNIRFTQTGTYIFDFQQGMREEKLGGISDIGFSIEKIK